MPSVYKTYFNIVLSYSLRLDPPNEMIYFSVRQQCRWLQIDNVTEVAASPFLIISYGPVAGP